METGASDWDTLASVDDEQPFSFTWVALQLLGQGLYSNPWSALSELVANGLDANASRVSVYIDMTDREHARIEIFDDGIGMSRDDVRIYAQVGHNKRNASGAGPDSNSIETPMGRKGIGKLAALYLSRNFYLRTRRGESDTTWQLDATDPDIDPESSPALKAVSELPPSENLGTWEDYDSGTFLLLEDVDLRGYGDQSFVALSARLANQFLLPSSGVRIELFVRRPENRSEPVDFRPVEKEVAFRNLVFVTTNFGETHPRPDELDHLASFVRVPAPRLREKVFEKEPEVTTFDPAPSLDDDETATLLDIVDFESKTYLGHPFQLEGWIGLHATINSEPARLNDERFRKNKYYNPAQLRIYVRGKLASDRLLTQLGITGTYLNYIEGELSFDLLDLDELRDIATSSRQDFDETDGRVLLLRALVRPVVRGLIQRRNDLASQITAMSEEQKQEDQNAGKAAFTKQFGADLDTYTDVPQQIRDEIHQIATNKIKGEVVAKDQFRVFISHSSRDSIFADLIYEWLLARGATQEEIFYTSKIGEVKQYGDGRALSDVIKQNIVSANTLIFYLTSRNFLSSIYCLFEGGAGWATRAVTEYLKLNVEYDSIPTFLSNGKPELLMLNAGDIPLSPELHNFLIEGIVNPMMEHLNLGRAIRGEKILELIPAVTFPSVVEMKKAGTTPSSYYDSELVEHWEAHVTPNLADYLADYLNP